MSPAFAGLVSPPPAFAGPASEAIDVQVVAAALIARLVPTRPERTVRGSPDTPTYLLVSVFRL
jgi:hypothetical protein